MRCLRVLRSGMLSAMDAEVIYEPYLRALLRRLDRAGWGPCPSADTFERDHGGHW